MTPPVKLKCPACDHGLLLWTEDEYMPAQLAEDLTERLTRYLDIVQATTCEAAAAHLYVTGNPSRAQIERARRRLESLVRQGIVVKRPGKSGGTNGGVTALYGLLVRPQPVAG